jgi:DNA-binding NarL/FixJ family response regulator
VTSSVRVLVVDDQSLVRESIASLLDIQPGIAVVGTAADGREAVERAVALAPDVVLMDVRMPELDGVAAVRVLRERAPGCRVVMLTTFDDEEYVLAALRAGATGYLLKDLPVKELAEAVRLTNAGVAQFDAAAAARLASALSGPDPTRPDPTRPDPTRPDPTRPDPTRPAPPPAGSGLTAREVDVLRLIAAGSTNREIAARLYLSEGTVKNHISRILGRLGLRDRTQAALYARDRGLV